MDVYPQRITGLSKNENGYRIVLTVVNPYADSARRARMTGAPYPRGRSYDSGTAKYLQPTPLIDPGNELLAGIADTLFTDEISTFAVINKALSFTHGFLSPDDSLARRIDAGTCRTLDVASIIKRRKGTCSEYANLFIALMRRKIFRPALRWAMFTLPNTRPSEATHGPNAISRVSDGLPSTQR